MDNKGNNNITPKNVVTANNVGYFLEQADNLNTAKVFLDSVITKFPGRAVAWLNLGDVNRKLGNVNKAVHNYSTYIELMNQKTGKIKFQNVLKLLSKKITKQHLFSFKPAINDQITMA